MRYRVPPNVYRGWTDIGEEYNHHLAEYDAHVARFAEGPLPHQTPRQQQSSANQPVTDDRAAIPEGENQNAK